MEEFFTDELFLLLALICVIVSFALWIRSRRRRKKELEWRRSLSDKIRGKFSRKNKHETAEMKMGDQA